MGQVHLTERLVKKTFPLGEVYFQWVPKPMARIVDMWFRSVCYLYSSRKDAELGSRSGASGFLFGVESQSGEYAHVYAVTNKHCLTEIFCPVENANPESIPELVVRASKRSGDETVIFDSTSRQDWEDHPNGDDLSICAVGTYHRDSPEVTWVMHNSVLTQELASNLAIGPGDDTFMVGRFVSHDGIQSNTPVARFGNISMNPTQAIKHNGCNQMAYLVEERSISGFSGSPVFVDIPPDSFRQFGDGKWCNAGDRQHGYRFKHLKLLGINCGHFPAKRDIIVDEGGNPMGKNHDRWWALIRK